MKVVRFLSREAVVLTGVIDTNDSDTASIIEGDIFGQYQVTARKAKIIRRLAPVLPPNIIGIGLNYKKYALVTGRKFPTIPVIFLKSTGTVIGSGEPIKLPKAGPDQVDFEAELAVIIGKTAKNVLADQAMDYVFGYSCANDVSARDWQIRKQKTQWTRGKSFDTFCPIGPCIITKDEIPDPHNLNIQADINGRIYQDSNTVDMIFDIPTIVSNLSQSFSLFPGTVILTGTPHGVGFTRIPPVYLQEGDIVTVSIDKIGCLVNPVILE